MLYAYKKVKEHRRQKAARAQETSPPLQQQDANSLEQLGSDAPIAKDDAAHDAKPKKERSPEEIADKKRRSAYRWKLIAGLCGPFALQALDTTIIASALSDIATEFRTFYLCLSCRYYPRWNTDTLQTRSSSSTGSSRRSTSPRPPFSSSGRK